MEPKKKLEQALEELQYAMDNAVSDLESENSLQDIDVLDQLYADIKTIAWDLDKYIRQWDFLKREININHKN